MTRSIPGINKLKGTITPLGISLGMHGNIPGQASAGYSWAFLLQSRTHGCVLRRSSFVNREALCGMSVSVSLHAKYEIRFTRNARSGDFATNRHEYCGPVWTLSKGKKRGLVSPKRGGREQGRTLSAQPSCEDRVAS